MKLTKKQLREIARIFSGSLLCDIGDEICTDSLLVVNQVSGRFKIKALHLRELCEQVRELIGRKQAKLTWISRDDNKAGKHFE